MPRHTPEPKTRLDEIEQHLAEGWCGPHPIADMHYLVGRVKDLAEQVEWWKDEAYGPRKPLDTHCNP